MRKFTYIIRNAMLVFTLPVLLLSCHGGNAGNELLSDFDYFFEELESIHPDPYSAFGGKAAFNKSVKELRKELSKRDALSLEEMKVEVSRLISVLHDGHTYFGGYFNVPMNVENGWIPMNFRVIPDGLIVNEVAEEWKALYGAAVNEVAGLPFEEFLDRMDKTVMTENRYGLLGNAKDFIRNTNTLRAVLPEFDSDSLTLGLRLAEGRDTSVTFPFFPEISPIWDTYVHPPQYAAMPRENLSYAFLDDNRNIMAFRMSNVVSADVQGYEHLEKTVAKEFGDMLTQMKQAESDTLIIDLRGNGGGWTGITYAALYEMFGKDFSDKDMGLRFRTRISEAYLAKNGMTLNGFNSNNGTSLKLGDFIESGGGTSNIEWYTCTDKDILYALEGKPIYTPEEIFVITDQGTFSAAFHFTYMLWKMGAKIVGVASGQAPNTFMELTQFTLPNSGTECSASNSEQVIFPDDDERANTLLPDIQLSYDDYKELGFNQDAEILYILKNHK